MATPTDPLGIDISATSDLDPHFRLVRGNENLSNALLRRGSCTPGALESIGDDPNYGYDLVGQLNSERSDAGSLAEIASGYRAQMLQDPRVQTAWPQVIAIPD
jgi:hypothetical protein